MTREEAIKILKENCCAMCAYSSKGMNYCDISSCDNRDAIQALEQEQKTVDLDKIRAEICEVAKGTMNENRAGGLYKALQIINKYREPTGEEVEE